MALFERGSVNLARTLSSLKHRDFRLLFIGTSLSHVGDFIQVMAQSWLVWTMTSSPFLLGVVGFCQAVPRLLLGAIGGAIVDRMEPRRLLVSTQILAMLQAFVFWALVYFESIQFWHIITLVLFLGTVNSVNQTARYSLINNLVPRDDLMNAIALNSSVSNLAKILGPSLGGVLISIIGVAGCLFVNAVSFLAIIGTLVIMKFPSLNAKTGEAAPFWEEVLEGYRFLRGQRRLFSIILLSYGVALLGAPYSRFLPVFATERLARRTIDLRFVTSGSWHRCGRCRAADSVTGQAATPPAFRCHECLCIFIFSDCLFLLSFTAVIDVAVDPGRRQRYRDARRIQFDHPNGNAAALVGPHIEPIFYG